MTFEAKKFGTVDDVFKAYDSGQCDVLTRRRSQLYALRQKAAKPGDHVILPDVISKEPLAPVVRQKDDDWLLLVKWTLFAMINAEELGIDSKNIGEAMKSKKPDVMRFVGTEGDYGEQLGLTKDWRAHHQARRQLRRGVRAQCRHRLEARHPARLESIQERRRHLSYAPSGSGRAFGAVRYAIFEARCPAVRRIHVLRKETGRRDAPAA